MGFSGYGVDEGGGCACEFFELGEALLDFGEF